MFALLIAGLWGMGVAFAAAPAEDAALERFEFTQKQMGVPFRIVLYAPGERVANHAADAAFARIKQLNGILSDYEPESELMQLCKTAGQGRPVEVGDDLWFVLVRSQEMSRASAGAFDVTVGPVVKLWRQARRKKLLPPPADLARATALVGYQKIRLDAESHKVELLKAGMQLDLGGIAKGYAADQTLSTLRKLGVTRALVAGSGDISVGDPPPGKQGWRIGIAPLTAPDDPPTRFVSLKNAAVATSGDAWQYVEIDGQRYSHIVDPHTGVGLTNRSSVTIIAPDGTTADSLATAVSVLGPERGLKLVAGTPGTAAFIIRQIDGKTAAIESGNFKEFVEAK